MGLLTEPSDERNENAEMKNRYHEMSDEKFFRTIRAENAELLGVSEEEMDEMSFTEIEERLDIVTTDPVYPLGSPEGYLDVGRYRVLSSEEYKERKETVEKFLQG